MGRKRGRAIEPMPYVEDTKVCPKCGPCSEHECKYKFLNNKSLQQPRYQCLKCNKPFHALSSRCRAQATVWQDIPRARHGDPPAVQARLKYLELKCPPCGAINNARFMYNNNESADQPRFKCRACGKQFQGTEVWKLEEPQGTQVLEQQSYDENYPHHIHNMEEGWKTNEACNNSQLQGLGNMDEGWESNECQRHGQYPRGQ